MREFTTAIEQAAEVDEDGKTFKVDGVECKCYQPSDGQIAVVMAGTSRHVNKREQLAAIINFFVAVLDEDSHLHITERLLDRNDPFGLDQITEIMEWMIEEWSGRPTKSPSVSTR